MKEVIIFLAEIVNISHDLLLVITKQIGLDLTDKDLHFWVIGIFGIVFFFFVHELFKVISRWSITVISFIYTFTLLVVLVFAIEIQQKITSRGNMEFQDAVIGLWGFIVLFASYQGVKLAIYFGKKLYHFMKERYFISNKVE
ncbi:hypothetical protein [Bacillus marinisedimentorum]|uniref:hypothetical protein n=1 Tax=Bacillus marinisedimentorum TaxID=1821260 RepID=UPI0007E294FF|nr:hypothetical protein [Bacillus marinisedimentorum]